MREELVAPCGMNCNICAAHLALVHDVRSKDIRMRYCVGCRERKNPCAFLMKRCDLLLKKKVRYCYECPKFPCDRLAHIDQRYRTNFKMSEIENLREIRDKGIGPFLKAEERKWKCARCGGTISCHNGLCFACDSEQLKEKKRPYAWDEGTSVRFDKRRK
jgi:hypothetical protein